MEYGSTNTADLYCETLNILRRAIQNRLHYFRWNVFYYPPYSPELALRDLYSKQWLGRHKFGNHAELKCAVFNYQLLGGDLLWSGVKETWVALRKMLET